MTQMRILGLGLAVAITTMTAAGCISTESATSAEQLGGSPPAGVSVARNGNQLLVSWIGAPDYSGYYVYQGVNGSTPAFTAGLAAPTSAFVATGLTAGSAYCYRVAGLLADGTLTDPSAAVCGVAATSGAFTVGPTISAPPMMAGNNNNWNPAGSATASLIRVTTGAGSPFLTGIAGGVEGRIVALTLASMGDPLTITTATDTSSAPENRFLIPLPTGAVFLQMTAVDQSVIFLYDGVSAKWRLIGKNF